MTFRQRVHSSFFFLLLDTFSNFILSRRYHEDMALTNSYEKHYLTNRRSTNDEKYVLILFKSDNTFIIKKKSNLHGVDENGLVNIKDRGKTYTGYCLFEGKFLLSSTAIVNQK